ncbi:hypothetical protein PG991_010445 [Apiospora marii]|uniref:DUF7918 domain-containing protein n=1 Tax=Apiospora marii TaxID=335849 RepID=A0ABR1RJQ5_9PEZI
MAVLDEVPGVGVVVRVRGRIAQEYPDRRTQPGPLPHRPPSTTIYIESFDDAEFSVEFAVDESNDFARDEGHYLKFALAVDGTRLKAVCDISREDVAVGHGRARNSLDRATSWDGQKVNCYVEKFRFPIVERDHRGGRYVVASKKDWGAIEVRVSRVVERQPAARPRRDLSLFDCIKVAEMARRGDDTTEFER